MSLHTFDAARTRVSAQPRGGIAILGAADEPAREQSVVIKNNLK